MVIRTPADLGAVIRSARKRLDMDQTELAQKIGVSRWWLVEIEKGKPRAEIGLILRTLNALQISLGAEMTRKSATKVKKAAIKQHRSSIDIDQIIEKARRAN
jgi:HTH-type transcriptional regulator/antitoxin HipB